MIKSKKVDIDIDQIEKNWCEDDFYRLFYNVLNAAIPGFERYVIKSMRDIRDDPSLDDQPRLRELTDIFVQQEVEHTKQHLPINRKIHLDKLVAAKYGEKISRFISKMTPNYNSVASSAFLEYVGFGFFEGHINKDVFYTSGMHEEMAKLWKWHVAEELEHSFIKLKVINHLDDSKWIKFWGMIEALIVSQLLVTILIPEIVWRDAKENNLKFWPHLWMFLKGVAKTEWGVNKESVGKYFEKGFDPEIKEEWVAGQIEKWVEETKAA